MSQNQFSTNKETHEFIGERTFEAPIERVWDAYADPEKLVRWWGPQGWETTSKEANFSNGGTWHYCMKCVDESQGEFFGQESWGKMIYDDIDEPNKIVYRDFFSDADGTINESLPTSSTVLEFHDQNGKTHVLTRTKYATADELQKVMDMGMEAGFGETWDRLAEFVEKA